MIATALILASLANSPMTAIAVGAAMDASLNDAVECIVDAVPYPSWDVPEDVIGGIKACNQRVAQAIRVRMEILGGDQNTAQSYLDDTIAPMAVEKVISRQRMR